MKFSCQLFHKDFITCDVDRLCPDHVVISGISSQEDFGIYLTPEDALDFGFKVVIEAAQQLQHRRTGQDMSTIIDGKRYRIIEEE